MRIVAADDDFLQHLRVVVHAVLRGMETDEHRLLFLTELLYSWCTRCGGHYTKRCFCERDE